jgi:hypothetical protein
MGRKLAMGNWDGGTRGGLGCKFRANDGLLQLKSDPYGTRGSMRWAHFTPVAGVPTDSSLNLYLLLREVKHRLVSVTSCVLSPSLSCYISFLSYLIPSTSPAAGYISLQHPVNDHISISHISLSLSVNIIITDLIILEFIL